MATPKFVPRPHGIDKEFFQKAIATGKVHVQRCSDCAHHQHPPRQFCATCGSRDLAFVSTNGQGSVYSWTVSHFTVDSGWVDDTPYATVVVEVAEGPRIVGCYSGDASTLEIGQTVSLRPEAKSEDFAFLWVDG